MTDGGCTKAEAAALQMFDDSPENVERQVGFEIELFLRTQIIDGNWTDQAFADVARECARIAAVGFGPMTEEA